MVGKGIRVDGIVRVKVLRQDDVVYNSGWEFVYCSRWKGWAGGVIGMKLQGRYFQIIKDVGYGVKVFVFFFGGFGGVVFVLYLVVV